MTLKKVLLYSGIGLLAGLALLEAVARFGLGLGDPPLSIPDSEIDYLFAPNQNCRRFGNRVVYNNVSMRMERDITGSPRPGQRRILLVGDSVVNGGVLTDQADLASTLLDGDLRAQGAGDVCNISAGSWGPMNYAAYFRKYGTFGATDLVLEVTAHDLWEDDPRQSAGCSVGKDVSSPDRKPLLACWEGFTRYLVPRVRRWFGVARINVKVDRTRNPEEIRNESARLNLEACAYLYSLPIERKVLVIHRTQKEWATPGIPPGEVAFREQAEAMGIRILLLCVDPETDYRDNIHLNVSGQYKLYQLLSDAIFGEDADDGK